MMAEHRSTTLSLPRGDRVVLLVGAPAVGLALGVIVFHLARWSATHVPLFRAPLKLITSWDSGSSTIVFAGLGVATGLAFAVRAFVETLAMRLTDDEVQLRKNRASATFARVAAAAVFLDGRQFVLLGRRSEELFRDAPGAPLARVEQAFREHGWPWTDSDPRAEAPT